MTARGSTSGLDHFLDLWFEVSCCGQGGFDGGGTVGSRLLSSGSGASAERSRCGFGLGALVVQRGR